MNLTNFSNFVGKSINDFLPKEYLLQPLWDHMRLEHGDFCRSPLFPVVTNVGFFFLLNIPFTIMDLAGERWPFIHQYKIQKNVKVEKERMLATVLHIAYNNVMFVLPASVYQWLYRPTIPLPEAAPSALEFSLGIVGGMLMFDFQYYWWHRIHHSYKGLYKYIHKIHHEHNSPFSWTTQYISVPELITVGTMSVINPILLNQHFLTASFTTLCNIYVSVEAHIGYDFPWGIASFVPFSLWGGSTKHDMHHMKPLTNFEPFFTHWDKVFGTDAEPLVTKNRDHLRKQTEMLNMNLRLTSKTRRKKRI